MPTKPTPSPIKPGLRVIRMQPARVTKAPLPQQALMPPAAAPLDRRQVRLRWD